MILMWVVARHERRVHERRAHRPARPVFRARSRVAIAAFWTFAVGGLLGTLWAPLWLLGVPVGVACYRLLSRAETGR